MKHGPNSSAGKDRVGARPWSRLDQLLDTAYDHGFELAVSSGSWEKSDGHVQSLTEFARTEARRVHAGPFDPERRTDDRLVDDQYRARRQRLDELQAIERHAVIQSRDADVGAAHTRAQLGPRPQISAGLAPAAIAAFAITVAPTLHDFIFHNMEEDLLAWLLSLGCGMSAGCFVVGAVLRTAGYVNNAGRRAGLIACALVCVGLGLLRASAVGALGELLFAVGLTAVEIGIVGTLEYVASRHQADFTAWFERSVKADGAQGVANTAQANLDRWQTLIRDLREQDVSFQHHVEDREERSIPLAELEDITIRHVHDGYNAGIAANHGALRGVGKS